MGKEHIVSVAEEVEVMRNPGSNPSKSGKRRIVGYDVVKSLAMLFVVILHYSFYTRYYSSGTAGTLLTTLCVVCVPLFFAVNGALLLPRPFDVRKHIRKTVTIVAVIAMWKNIVALFCIFVDKTHPVTVKDFLRFQLGGGFGEYPTGYFWFMNALIAVYLVYPLIKMLFDCKDGIALKATLAVLFTFTVGKDTLVVLLDMLGAATHHEFSSILDSMTEFYIFGSYGYVMLYFLVGGLIAREMFPDGPKGEIRWPFHSFNRLHAVLVLVLCYALSFGVQRFQHATKGTNLTIDYGYWLLPTFVATCLALMVCLTVGTRRTGMSAAITGIAGCVGRNTFGVYMLHMMAIVLFSKAQTYPAIAAVFEARLGSGWLVTVMNLACVLVLFACCLGVSVIARRIPGIRTLFAV